MDQVKFVEDNLRDMICLSSPYHFKFFKGCLQQILTGPLLNTLTHLKVIGRYSNINEFTHFQSSKKKPFTYNYRFRK